MEQPCGGELSTCVSLGADVIPSLLDVLASVPWDLVAVLMAVALVVVVVALVDSLVWPHDPD
jgi:hypothetical protein